MGLDYTSYFGLARVSDMGPEVKAWSATDLNPEVISLLLKSLTQHKHGGATPIRYPGYNYAAPSTPISPTVAEATGSVGVLSPGASIGVRLAYLDNLGLETESSPEIIKSLAALPERALPPEVGIPVSTPVGNAVGGGTYVYTLTKGKGTGETQVSGIAQVDVPYTSGTNSYVVPVTFVNFGTYTDGTDKLRLYRSTGLTSDFQLIKTFTDANTASYNDNGSIEVATQFPPRTNTFDKNKYLAINWSGISNPSAAVVMRVYITQNPGVYGVNHLLMQVNLATPHPVQTNYLGSETLSGSWPKEFSQLPGSPSKVNLGLEATGAPILTEYMNFAGYESLNFVLPWNVGHATPIRGNMYYDFATDAVKVRLANGYVTLATPSGTFIHSPTESGGHVATNIVFGNTNQFNLGTLTTALASTTGSQIRKQVNNIKLATPSTVNYKTTSSASSTLLEMEVNTFTPSFAGQMVQINLNASLYIDTKDRAWATGSVQLELNNSTSLGDGTQRSFTANATPQHMPLDITYTTPISSPLRVRALWWVTQSNVGSVNAELISLGNRRQLLVREIF